MNEIIEISGVLAAVRAVRKMTPAAKRFIKRKVDILIHKEGYRPAQAVAVAYNMARSAGYKVPKLR